MGAAFNRWLARPSTLHFLRHLIAPTEEHVPVRCRNNYRSTAKRCHRPRSFTSLAGAHEANEDENAQHDRRRGFRVINPTLERRVLEQGLHMSLSSQVNLLEDQKGDSAFSALRREADVDSDEHVGQLLVDRPEHRDKFRLWIELLQFRYRIDGYEGVCAIWRGMRRREVVLPTEGVEADVLWTTFAQAGSSEADGAHKSMVDELCLYAEDLRSRTNRYYSKLYKTVLTRMLLVDWHNAKSRHDWFSKVGLLPVDGVKQLVGEVISFDAVSRSGKPFKQIYLATQERNIYDTCITILLEKDNEEVTLKWHRFFLNQGDPPSQAMFARPDVQRLFDRDNDKSLPVIHVSRLAPPPVTTPNVTPAAYPALTRSTMSTLVGDVHGIKPKEIGDNFVAKMFATRAFSLDLVIRGLSFFGVDMLGPLALREMALRAGSLVVFREKLDDLRSMKITISNAVYSRLLIELVRESHSDLFESLLQSDQHPEAFADFRTQESLLASFLDQNHWNNAQITLICLSLVDTRQQSYAMNRILQHYLRNRQWQQVAHLMHTLQSQRVPLTQRTIVWLYHFVLPVRQPGKRPIESQRTNKPDFDALDFVTRAYMYGDETSRHVHSKLWVELLKRYGKSFRWDEMRKLALWLARRYSAERFRVPAQTHNRRQRTKLLASSPLHRIFSVIMQKAIVHWGFYSAASRGKLHADTARRRPYQRNHDDCDDTSEWQDYGCEYWARGIALLGRLKRDSSVPVETSTVLHAFRLRMSNLFGPAHSQLWLNEQIRESNTLSLAHYIRHANEVWCSTGNDPLIVVDPALLEQGNDDYPPFRVRLSVALFGRYWSTHRRTRREFVDVAAWSTSQSVAARRPMALYRGRNMAERRRTWQRSAFRYCT